MKWIAVIFVALALALGFFLGRATAPAPETELASVDSFRQSLEDPDWLTRTYRFSSFLMGLNPENLPEALEALEPHLPWLLTDEFRLFMLAWTRFDPVGAFAQAQAWPPQIRRNAGGTAMYAWGFRNPLEAVRALSAVEDPDLQEFWGARLLAGWAHGEYRDSASDYIAKMPEGTIRLSYLGTLAWEISKEGPEAVMRWAEEVSDEPLRFKQGVFLKAASTLAGVDAPGTARWLSGHLEHDYVDDALMIVAASWATNDGLEAMEWLTGLPASEKRDTAVRAGFRVWHGRSPREAERWLESVSPAFAVDPAVHFMIERTREKRPQVARRWATRLASKP
ncbi:MAG: hypothetical protein JRF15_03650 [Deltaproteobacteria bacterium]|jgi:hypothetical protein|nr:hypothetical protein [Deltaproteobacteria bacterium]